MDHRPPLSREELSSVLVTLIALTGDAASGQMPLQAQFRLRARLASVGAVEPSAPLSEVSQVLGDLIQHLHLLNEPDSPAEHTRMLIENAVAFDDEATAQRYAEDMRSVGKDVDGPVHEPAFKRWTVAIHTVAAMGDDRQAAGTETRAALLLGGWHLGGHGLSAP